MSLTPERHTAEPAQPVSEREGFDAQGAPVSGQPEVNSPCGVFVTFEGGDGVGKSTHIRYVADELRRAGREVVCLREPGGTGIGESLRAMVLDPENGEISSEAELLMYEAARAQLVCEVIRPALERGAVVLCDRFADSTIAYQAYGRGLPLDFVRRANAFATGGIVPDRTILLVLGNTRKSLARATGAGAGDRMEQAGEVFHSRVNDSFPACSTPRGGYGQGQTTGEAQARRPGKEGASWLTRSRTYSASLGCATSCARAFAAGM